MIVAALGALSIFNSSLTLSEPTLPHQAAISYAIVSKFYLASEWPGGLVKTLLSRAPRVSHSVGPR